MEKRHDADALVTPEVPLLEVRGLTKAFNSVLALEDGRLTLLPGTVHALCGGNGAGKSTFLNIIMGQFPRDAGEILVNGQPVEFSSPSDALKSGIAMIAQELAPIPSMSVAENIYLAREPRRWGPFVDHRRLRRDAEQLLEELAFDVPASARMEDLSLAQTQLVEIAKALSRDASIIIMDEPTSAIGEHEVHILSNAIERLRRSGKGVIYVSHKLTEIFDFADHYTIFRDGRFIESGLISDIDRKHLVTQIVGREVRTVERSRIELNGPPLLVVDGLCHDGSFQDISLELKPGEVLALYGLLGSGRTEFLETVFGVRRADKGSVSLDGARIPTGNPGAAIRLGMAMVPEDRKHDGLVLGSSIAHNITLAPARELSIAGFRKTAAEKNLVTTMMKSQNIKAASAEIAVERLSGGNQQKVVLARCLVTKPKLLICDEPTRGIDEGSKQEIYAFLRAYAAEGNAVLLVSSEAPEVLQVSDRIIIFKAGRVAKEIQSTNVTQRELVDHAS